MYRRITTTSICMLTILLLYAMGSHANQDDHPSLNSEPDSLPLQVGQPEAKEQVDESDSADRSAMHQTGNRGCSFHSAAGVESVTQNLMDFSGYPMLDQFIFSELNFMTQLFGVRPRFFYMVESGGGNAYATPDVMDPSTMYQYPDGTILFGLKLIQGEQLSMQASLPGILAHEMGHILQNKLGSPLQGKARELQADYLAGWYLAKRQMFVWTDVQGTFRAMFQRGDYAFNTTEHHGTPEQRLLAIASGFQGINLDIMTAYQNAAALASNL